MNKLIQLTKGYTAIVDDIDFDRVNSIGWVVNINKKYNYIRAIGRCKEQKRNVYMHRFILNIKDSKIKVDHINGNPLDNRRKNLRICTQGQNVKNQKRSSKNTSGYKGVAKKDGKWRARIWNNNQEIWLGIFETKEEAAIAYNNAALKYHGEYAKINKLKGTS